tara:strand:+ start:148 stop:357 length:210 start_codon:yes stop_codon:yes gene_type:complete
MNVHSLDYTKLKKLSSDTMYQKVDYICPYENKLLKYIVILDFSSDDNFDYDYVECKYLTRELENTKFYL